MVNLLNVKLGILLLNSITQWGVSAGIKPTITLTSFPGGCSKGSDAAYSSTDYSEIFLNKDCKYKTVEDLQTVITHEMGHLLGVRHSSDVRSIMFPIPMRDNDGILESDKLNIGKGLK